MTLCITVTREVFVTNNTFSWLVTLLKTTYHEFPTIALNFFDELLRSGKTR
ncbi:MAG: hypothetical protein HC780_10920 [Leptolyngbyaceae cyanobacterium CSU_1_3]|nr:hypothetical protein [Leptolyngbyaceae cyanobacterium CSU_1_3]